MPIKTVTYEIGSTIYGAPLSLTYTRGSAGEKQWILRKEAANQRDDSVVIAGLTDEQLELMKQALDDHKRCHHG